MEKQLLRARTMARLFPHTGLHVFTIKGAYNDGLIDSRLSTDGNSALWEAAAC